MDAQKYIKVIFENYAETHLNLKGGLMNHPRENAVQELEEKAKEVNKSIDKLQVKLEELPRKYSEEGKALMSDLKAKKARFENRLESFKDATSKSSGDLRAGAELAFDELKLALKSAKDRFNNA